MSNSPQEQMRPKLKYYYLFTEVAQPVHIIPKRVNLSHQIVNTLEIIHSHLVNCINTALSQVNFIDTEGEVILKVLELGFGFLIRSLIAYCLEILQRSYIKF